MLLAAAGTSNAEIARRVGCSEDTARVWRDRFAADSRAEALLDLPRSGRPATVELATTTGVRLSESVMKTPHRAQLGEVLRVLADDYSWMLARV